MSYEVDGREYNSIVNQEIKRKFVDQNVFANISDMADALFDYGDCGSKYADYSEFSNYWVKKCPHCGEEIEWEDCEVIEEETELSSEVRFCPGCGRDMSESDLDEDLSEICEYYIVSEFLGQRLRDKGECVLPRTMGWIWGRCGSGQAIYLDGVISEICEGMEILEGQSRSWKRKEA